MIDLHKITMLKLNITNANKASELSPALEQLNSVEVFDLLTNEVKTESPDVESILKNFSCPQTLQEFRYEANYSYNPGALFKEFFKKHRRIKTLYFDLGSSNLTNSELFEIQIEINKLPDLTSYCLTSPRFINKEDDTTKLSPLLESFSGMKSVEELNLFKADCRETWSSILKKYRLTYFLQKI